MDEETPIKEANKVANEVNHNVMVTMDSYHPLYLHANDNPVLNMISIVPLESENYAMWHRAMRYTLLGRNKQCFVTDICMREKYDSAFHHL